MPREQCQTVKEIAGRLGSDANQAVAWALPDWVRSLKVSEATVRDWVEDGRLQAFEIGSGWRIADSGLAALLCSHATRANGPVKESIRPGAAAVASHDTGA